MVAHTDKFPDKLKRLFIRGDGDAGRVSNLWSSRRHFETQLANTRLLTRRNLSGVRGWNFLRLPLLYTRSVNCLIQKTSQGR